jgi:hypothetical protein
MELSTFYKDTTTGYIFAPTQTKTDGTNKLIAVKNPLTNEWLTEKTAKPFSTTTQPILAPIIENNKYDIYSGTKEQN